MYYVYFWFRNYQHSGVTIPFELKFSGALDDNYRNAIGNNIKIEEKFKIHC